MERTWLRAVTKTMDREFKFDLENLEVESQNHLETVRNIRFLLKSAMKTQMFYKFFNK